MLTFPCGCERTAKNTYSSAGRERCRYHYNQYMRDYRERAAQALREKKESQGHASGLKTKES